MASAVNGVVRATSGNSMQNIIIDLFTDLLWWADVW